MKLLTILLIVFSNYTFSQYSKIKFNNLEILEGRKFLFKINGTLIEPNIKNYTFEVNKEKLDTIVFYDNFKDKTNLGRKFVSYGKFRENETYIIRINMCSGYEIYPEKKARIGEMKIFKNREPKGRIISFCGDEIPLSKRKSKYYKCHPSAMCTFSSKKIELLDNNEKIIDYLKFHFLHGEKLKIEIINNRIKIKTTANKV